MFKKIFAFVLLISVFSGVNAFAYYSPGQPTGFVNDYAKGLSVEVKQKLETELSNFQKETKHEIAVVTIESLKGDSIENFANKLFNEWGIGAKEKNGGVLLLLATQDRNVRIEVGLSLEKIVTAAQANRILQNFGKPYLKDNNYNQGIPAMAAEIEKVIRAGEVAVATTIVNDNALPSNYWLKLGLGFSALVIILLLIIFLPKFGKSKKLPVDNNSEGSVDSSSSDDNIDSNL